MKKTKKYLYLCIALLVGAFVIPSCSDDDDPEVTPVTVDFTTAVDGMTVTITNKTTGADAYTWTFTGGTPANSSAKDPGTVTYAAGGDYKIKLEASNASGGTGSKEVTVTITEAEPEPAYPDGLANAEGEAWVTKLSLTMQGKTQEVGTLTMHLSEVQDDNSSTYKLNIPAAVVEVLTGGADKEAYELAVPANWSYAKADNGDESLTISMQLLGSCTAKITELKEGTLSLAAPEFDDAMSNAILNIDKDNKTVGQTLMLILKQAYVYSIVKQ